MVENYYYVTLGKRKRKKKQKSCQEPLVRYHPYLRAQSRLCVKGSPTLPNTLSILDPICSLSSLFQWQSRLTVFPPFKPFALGTVVPFRVDPGSVISQHSFLLCRAHLHPAREEIPPARALSPCPSPREGPGIHSLVSAHPQPLLYLQSLLEF